MEPKVSLILEPEQLIESEATLSLLTLNLSEPPPPGGIVVRLNAPNLSEFDLSQAQIEGGTITLEDELEQQLQTALDGTRVPEVPGAVVAIVAPFGSWYGASGVADLENNIPLQPSDRFQIGSITKTFVATTVLQLVEEGSLSLEDTLTTWLPESLTTDIPNAQAITLRQLLQHTSGVADYLDILFTQAATNPTVFLRPWEPEQLIDLIDGVEPVFEPGASWQYSNTNYILAGLIVEAATGNNIAQEIRDRILTPLNLENTFFAQEEAVPGGVVNGYWDFDSNGTLDNITPAGLSWAWTAGAMISNAQDLDTFARSLLKEDRLLEPETLEQMLDVIPTINNNNYDSYGLGVGTLESAIRFWYAHRGQTLGYRSNMWYSPQDDLTYIELINGFSRDNLVRDILPLYRQGIADDTFEVTLTEQTAQIALPVADDGEIEGEETATFSLEAGEGYEVDPDAQTGTLTIFDTISEETITQVSLSTSTNFAGDLNALVEDLGNALTVRFDLDEPAPEGGLKVFVDSNVEQIVNRLDLPGFAFNPITENINPALLGTSFDNSGFYLTIDEGATFGTFTIDVFDNPEPDTFLPETFDGLVEAVFELKTEVEPEDLADVGTLGDYTIDPDAASSTVFFADDESQLSEISEPPLPEPPTSDLPLVSLHTGPDFLVETEGTVSAHVFNVTNVTIPEGGLVVSVSAPGLGEFDLDAINVSEGGEIVAVREDGFDIRLTDFTVLVDLPIADDGETEGLETTSFTLEAGKGYQVNSNFSSGEFTLVDTAEEIPTNLSNRNDIIPLANDIGLSPDNPEVVVNGSFEFDIGNRYQNEDGSFTYVDAPEDVDFYKFDLKAGDIVTFDTDAVVEGNPPIPETVFDFDNNPITVSRLFDADGNELAVNVTGQGPGELFIGGADDYIEFEAPADGTYYLGISDFPNATTQRLSTPDSFGKFPYNPFIPASGNGESYVDFLNLGDYELKVTLNPESPVLLADQLNRSNNTPPESIDVAAPGEPTVSLNFNTATYASFYDPRVVSGELNEDDILNGNLIEGSPFTGSVLNMVLTTEGEIPEEGIVVTVNSNGYLRDYFSNRSFETPPFSPGAELVDVVTDDTGRETGFQLRIFEPVSFFPLNARTPYWGELVEPGANGLEFQPETDGPEEVTFFLEGGEGYGVSETANQITPTFYDSAEQAPEPSVIPEVSLTISETELIESERTETTLNFSLSEAPPEEGVLVYVKGVEGILPQFDVLNAEVTGGVYPTGNFEFSGFFFKITEPVASINLTAFEDPFTEGLQGYSLALQETPLYTINSDAGEVNFTIADNPDSVLEVSLSSESVAVESDNTPGLLTFNLTANPPESGIEVTVNADKLSEFDTEAFTIMGGEITEITDTGFSLNITDTTAMVELPPLSDGEAEGPETATFSLVESADYLIDADAPEATVTLVDVPEQVPVTAELGSNDSISEALDINLNLFNTSVKIAGGLNSQEPLEDYSETVEPTEDVDFYSFNLNAGDTVKLDIDTVPFEVPKYEGIEQRLDSQLRLFDANGNELASVNNAAAPDEEFSRDPYLEFTAESAGTYYVGISQLGNNDYDPLVDDNLSNGSGWFFPEIGVFYGDYELNVSLTPASVVEEPTLPVFGTLDGETIEVGSDEIVFSGAGDDLIDSSAGGGGNRLYGQSGDDTFILGSGDRALAGAGDDSFFLLGGDNIITGGAGMDQFWIANAEIPESANTITDFDLEADVLGIRGLGIGFDDLTLTQNGADTSIGLGEDELAKLLGVNADSLSAANFDIA